MTDNTELLKSSTMPELSVNQIELIKNNRKPWSWTSTNVKRGNDLVRIFNDMHRWWPLTERQLFYRLISNQCINESHWCKNGNINKERIKDVYGTVGQLLKWLRINEFVPWEAITDETRVLTQKVGFSSAKTFVEQEIDNMFKGYSRCVAADQKNYIEVWIEKQALLRIVEPIADKYCRRVMCCKGYGSITFQKDFYDRASEALAKGYKPMVLYFGDWDPSGVDMTQAAMQTLTEELGLFGVDYYRCGINPEHFKMIHADPVPLKPTDSRSKEFIKKHGSICYELDAFHPLQLESLVENSIKHFTNMDAIACNRDIQKKEADLLATLKTDVKKYVSEKFDSMGGNEYVNSSKPLKPEIDTSVINEIFNDIDFSGFMEDAVSMLGLDKGGNS